MTTKKRMATPPGEVLLKEFMESGGALGVGVIDLAEELGVPHAQLQQIIDGRRSIDQRWAELLGRRFGTSSRYWLNLQRAHDGPRGTRTATATVKVRVLLPEGAGEGEAHDALDGLERLALADRILNFLANAQIYRHDAERLRELFKGCVFEVSAAYGHQEPWQARCGDLVRVKSINEEGEVLSTSGSFAIVRTSGGSGKRRYDDLELVRPGTDLDDL